MYSDRRSRARQRIIDEASQLILDQGLGNFRIDALSGRLGYSRQNIYRYFPGKQAILDAVIVDGCRTMVDNIAETHARTDVPFDEQLIDGILAACDLLRGGKRLNSYAGRNLSQGVSLFMTNSGEVQAVLLEYLRPLYDEAKQRGELYLNMSYADITRWVFRIAISELISGQYEPRETRREFLLTMFSPSINARKAGANATIDTVHPSHVR